jgi:hypothetical protein
MIVPVTSEQLIERLCSCLRCRRAVYAGSDGWTGGRLSDVPTHRRRALWARFPALTFTGLDSASGGDHLCFPHPGGVDFDSVS